MKRRTVLAALAAALLLAGCAGHARPLQEDDPGWNCHTMGNHQCGPTPSGAQ